MLGSAKFTVPKSPESTMKEVIPPVEEAVVEGEEPGNHALVEPDKPGGDLLRSAPLVNRFLEVCAKGFGIGTEERYDRENTDDDTLRPVDEHHRGKVPVPEDREHDGDKVCKDEGDEGEIMDEIPREYSRDDDRGLHYVCVARKGEKRAHSLVRRGDRIRVFSAFAYLPPRQTATPYMISGSTQYGNNGIRPDPYR